MGAIGKYANTQRMLVPTTYPVYVAFHSWSSLCPLIGGTLTFFLFPSLAGWYCARNSHFFPCSLPAGKRWFLAWFWNHGSPWWWPWFEGHCSAQCLDPIMSLDVSDHPESEGMTRSRHWASLYFLIQLSPWTVMVGTFSSVATEIFFSLSNYSCFL